MKLTNNELQDFWKKKTIVSYYLSILVFWIHISTCFSGYDYVGTGGVIVKVFQAIVMKAATPIAVPLFFILSGAVFFRNYSSEKYVSSCKKTLHTLVIPYLLWNALNMFFVIFASYSFLSRFFVGREKFEINLLNVLNAILFRGCYRPFWFVFCLILFRYASPIFDFLLSKKTTIVVGFVVLGLLSICDVSFASDIAVYACINTIWYYLGCYIGKYHFDWFARRIEGHFLRYYLVLLLCTVYMVSYALFSLEDIPAIRTLVILVMCFAFWRACDMFIPALKERTIYTHSFFVYAMHLNIMAAFAKIYHIILPKNVLFAIPNFILTTVSTLLIVEVVCFVLQRHCKPIYRVLSGGR